MVVSPRAVRQGRRENSLPSGSGPPWEPRTADEQATDVAFEAEFDRLLDEHADEDPAYRCELFIRRASALAEVVAAGLATDNAARVRLSDRRAAPWESPVPPRDRDGPPPVDRLSLALSSRPLALLRGTARR